MSTKILPGVLDSVSRGYQISKSLRFDRAKGSSLYRDFGTPTTKDTWTFSTWFKRSSAGFGGNQAHDIFGGGPTNTQLWLYDTLNMYSEGAFYFTTAKVFRDTSAWYHLIVAANSSADGSNKIRVYVNGSEITVFTADTRSNFPNGTGGQISGFNQSGIRHYIGDHAGLGNKFDGYMADTYFIDGQQLTPSSFGEFNDSTGQWVPKPYTGTYGNNGFFLNYSDSSAATAVTIGKDSSGRGNNFTPVNFTVAPGISNDSLTDTPTPYGVDTGVGGQIRGNYATLNYLDYQTNTGIIKDGALYSEGTNTTRSTISVTSGKWYAEFTKLTSGDSDHIGVVRQDSLISESGWTTGTHVWWRNDGVNWYNGTSTSGSATFSTNDVISVLLDCDNKTITMWKNGVVSSFYNNKTFPPQFYYADGTVRPLNIATRPNPGCATHANFGQRPFAYTAPNGYYTLNTMNLARPVIGSTLETRANTVFDTKLYTGNGTTSTVSNYNFSPDLLWIKMRSTAGDHYVFDTVRGNNLGLYPSRTYRQEASALAPYYTQSFASNGFQITQDAGGNEVNYSGNTYVAWGWDAGSSSVSNTAGTVTSTVRVNENAGFSIVKYNTGSNTGAYSFGHGLNKIPKFIMLKGGYDSDDYNWDVYHVGVSPTQRLILNSAGNPQTQAGPWNNTTPTSSVVYQNNQSYAWYGQNKNNIAYCFTDIPGYSSFGTYVGNGSTDGSFVHTGFKPALVIVKNITTDNNFWNMYDSVRDPVNPNTARLYPNGTNAEEQGADVDFLSTGFKPKTANDNWNLANNSYVYAAFAEVPFKYTLGS